MPVGRDDLAIGRNLVAVQKFGSRPRHIDTGACEARGIKVLTVRRRANIACAEVALMLMLTLAKKMQRVMNRISAEQLAAVGYGYKPFDRRHTPNSNWARITGLRMLNESTIGIIGLGIWFTAWVMPLAIALWVLVTSVVLLRSRGETPVASAP